MDELMINDWTSALRRRRQQRSVKLIWNEEKELLVINAS